MEPYAEWIYYKVLFSYFSFYPEQAVVFLFIVFSLVLSFLVQSDSPWLALVQNTVVLYSGLGICIASFVIALLKKNKAIIFHDVFAVSSLLVWFSYWRTLFNEESPFFFVFPLYFVFIGAVIESLLLSQQSKPDQETLGYMYAIASNSRLQLWLVMVVVLISLGLEEHYLLYPTAITILLIRIALHRYLEAAAKQ